MTASTARRRVFRLRAAPTVCSLCVVVLAACSVPSDDAPRDIEQGAAEVASPDQVSGAEEATGSGRIFLVAPASPGLPDRLRSVARDVADNPTAVLDALLAGPNTTEFIDQYRSALPVGLQVNTVSRAAGGVVVVDVSDAIQVLSGDVLIVALAQIVYSLNEVTGVDSVLITVNGAHTQWPASNGQLHSAPLTVYHFPGFEPSSQPEYPAVPSD